MVITNFRGLLLQIAKAFNAEKKLLILLSLEYTQEDEQVARSTKPKVHNA